MIFCKNIYHKHDKVYQLLAQGRWLSPGTPASSTTKTGCHDIAEKLLKIQIQILFCLYAPLFASYFATIMVKQ